MADLREVVFLDSTGLGALVGSLKRLREKGGSLTLVTSPGRITHLFTLTGLAKVFALHPSVREAIAGDPSWASAVTSGGGTGEEWCREHGLV